MKSIRIYKILSVAVLLAGTVSGLTTQAFAAPEDSTPAVSTPHVIYHDQNGSIIQREVFTAPYQFDEDMPPFFVELPFKNVAWNTKADGTGTSYNKKSAPLESLTEDLNVYAVIQKGHFVRFESNGGTPVEYQFVLPGGKAMAPTAPTKAGYNFKEWTNKGTAFDFNTVITEDTQLLASWTPKEVTYTVRVWLEKSSHPNRSSIEDAIENIENDYSYSISFLKNGVTNQDAEFTDKDRNNSQIQSLIFSKTTAGMIPDKIQTYFYDDKDYSYAKSLTEKDIDSINDNGGIAGDGTTVINVYYRRYYWMAKLYSNSNNLVAQGVEKNKPGWTFELRNGETVKNALSRKKYNEFYSYFEKMNEMYPTFMSWMNKDITKDPFIFRLQAHDGYYDGTYQDMLNRTFDVLAMQNTGRFTSGAYFADGDQLDLKLEDANNKGEYEWHRYHFVQTIESARANNETDYTHANENNFNLKRENVYWYNYSDYNTLCSWSNTPLSGCSYYFIQSVKRDDSGTIIDYYPKTMLDGYDGKPHPYVGGSNYPGMPYRLEFYLLRKRYIVDFETYDFVTYKAPNPPQQSVVYEDEISRIAPDIKTKDAEGNEIRFIIDETQFKDSRNVVWVFKGWYDNELFLGEPIDFDHTTLKMGASSKHFYAKWEPKTIKAIYDGNGGKVEGKDKTEKTQPSGRIPERPADPEPPEGMIFYCWTVNGKPYYFEDPIVDDTQLVAVYYSKYNNLRVSYLPGEGAGQVPVDENRYLVDANPEVLAPTASLIAPPGTFFIGWNSEGYNPEEHSDKPEFAPGDEFTIKKDTKLTAMFSVSCELTISKSGMKAGESAVFTVKKKGGSAVLYYIRLKGTGSDPVTATVTNLEPGEYTVEETSWSWAYNATKPEPKTQDISNDPVFEFTNVAKEVVPLHSEADKENSVAGHESRDITVDVDKWKKGEDRKITF